MEDSKVANARTFCAAYLGDYACNVLLSGSEVIAFKETIDRLAKKLDEREMEIERLRVQIPDLAPLIYLMSPYTHEKESVMEWRYEQALYVTAKLLSMDIHVYSPIVHCHELAKRHDLPREVFFWEDYNKTMMERATEFYVLLLPGHDTSPGIKKERAYAEDNGIKVTEISPEDYK